MVRDLLRGHWGCDGRSAQWVQSVLSAGGADLRGSRIDRVPAESGAAAAGGWKADSLSLAHPPRGNAVSWEARSDSGIVQCEGDAGGVRARGFDRLTPGEDFKAVMQAQYTPRMFWGT